MHGPADKKKEVVLNIQNNLDIAIYIV